MSPLGASKSVIFARNGAESVANDEQEPIRTERRRCELRFGPNRTTFLLQSLVRIFDNLLCTPAKDNRMNLWARGVGIAG